MRAAGLAVLLGALALVVILPGPNRAQAESARQPVYQDTSYPAQGGTPEATVSPDNGYPVDATNAAGLTETPAPAQGTPSPVFSATPTQTEMPNVFRTEDSEMSGAKVTAPASETPGPSITPVYTATVTSSPVAMEAAAIAKKKIGLGDRMDWGLFWIGFSIPVVAACGAVLYLLDQRPGFFRRVGRERK